MGERKNLSVVVVEVVGGPSHDALGGDLEARHVVERCVRRIDLAVEAYHGTHVRKDDMLVCATFERSEQAVLATCEMLERTQTLPPLRGQRLAIRAGIHHGVVATGAMPQGDGVEVAMRLAAAAKGGQALATAAAVMQLPTATRHFARPDTVERPELEDLEWPLFSVARKPESVVSLPPATKLAQRLRIRHQAENLLLDDQRPILLLGRELGNDVVIMDPRASRQHCRIERRRNGFVLIDHSTNGCYVVDESGGERCVKGGEVPLIGPGRIGCGFSANEVERDLVFFETV